MEYYAAIKKVIKSLIWNDFLNILTESTEEYIWYATLYVLEQGK